jgi:hypothetical protein
LLNPVELILKHTYNKEDNYIINVAMFKKSLLIGFTVLTIVGALFSQRAFAKTCEEDYLKDDPGGTVPTTNPALQSNCSSLASRSGEAIHLHAYNDCSYPPTWFTVQWCRAGTPFVTYATGEVILYSQDLFFRVENVRGDRYQGFGKVSDVATGVMVNAGETMKFWVGEYAQADGLGWRTYVDQGDPTMQAFFNLALADSAAKGYTVISQQTWSDKETTSLYDSHDFDDESVLIAIKKTIVDCDNSDVTLSSDPSSTFDPLMLGVNPDVKLIRTGKVPLLKYVMNSNSLDVANTLGCTWSELQGRQQERAITCSVDRKPPYPATTVTWTHTWCNTNNASCNPALDKICSTSLPLNIEPYGPYLKTDLGTSFVRGNVTLPRFPISPLSSQTFSKYIYSTQGSNTPTGNLWLSGKNYVLSGYNDINGRADYYEYIKKSLILSAKTETRTGNVTLTTGNYSSIVGDNDVVTIQGNLTLDSATCNSKTIFFVAQNLYIETNFNINGDNACLFVVAGDTIVNPAVGMIKAFVITNRFDSQESTTQLVLTGGLIVQTANTFSRSYNRDITEASELTNLRKTTPSELFNYEGARYLKLLGFLLNAPTTLSIRETQYTKGSN